ncbi:MAG: hypothetical protein GY861_21430 [bacterium]|nr:hypothetical protein [bacterium]
MDTEKIVDGHLSSILNNLLDRKYLEGVRRRICADHCGVPYSLRLRSSVVHSYFVRLGHALERIVIDLMDLHGVFVAYDYMGCKVPMWVYQDDISLIDKLSNVSDVLLQLPYNCDNEMLDFCSEVDLLFYYQGEYYLVEMKSKYYSSTSTKISKKLLRNCVGLRRRYELFTSPIVCYFFSDFVSDSVLSLNCCLTGEEFFKRFIPDFSYLKVVSCIENFANNALWAKLDLAIDMCLNA